MPSRAFPRSGSGDRRGIRGWRTRAPRRAGPAPCGGGPPARGRGPRGGGSRSLRPAAFPRAGYALAETGRSPASASRSSLCPFPETPAIPTISPSLTVNETSRTRVVPRSSRTLRFSTASRSRPGRASPFSTRSSTRRPTISSASSGMVVPAVSRWATIAPSRITDTRSVTSMTSRSLWVMRMIVFPCSFRRRRMRNRWSASCGVSAPVGSSRIRISAPRKSALRISTRCCSSDGKVPHPGVRGHFQGVVPCQLLQHPARPQLSGGEERSALRSEHHVLDDAEGIHQHEVLVDHADAGGDGVLAAFDGHRPPGDPDLAPVRPVEAVEDAHQGGLAGAVLAHQSVNRAARDREAHVPVRMDTPEALVHAPELDRRHGGALRHFGPRRRPGRVCG